MRLLAKCRSWHYSIKLKSDRNGNKRFVEAIRDRVVGEKGGFRPGSAMELFRVLFSSHSTVLVVSAVCRLVADVLSLVNPVLLSLVLQWFESEEKGDWNGIPLGYCYAFLLLLSSLVMTSLLQWHHHLGKHFGIPLWCINGIL